MSSSNRNWNSDLFGSMLVTAFRGGYGVRATPARNRPPLMFELWEFEACPYCRIVREALTELDLDALIRPCPVGGTRYRPEPGQLGGKAQVPYFRDPNTGVEMYESADIVTYLFETYGEGLPLHWRAPLLVQLGSAMAGLPRVLAGRAARPSRLPERPLELFSFEASPYARPVRETLCELELPWVLRSVGRTTFTDWIPPRLRRSLELQPRPETPNRCALYERTGELSIPYLIDPNTGVEMRESAEIVEYLNAEYAVVPTREATDSRVLPHDPTGHEPRIQSWTQS